MAKVTIVADSQTIEMARALILLKTGKITLEAFKSTAETLGYSNTDTASFIEYATELTLRLFR